MPLLTVMPKNPIRNKVNRDFLGGKKFFSFVIFMIMNKIILTIRNLRGIIVKIFISCVTIFIVTG